MPSTSIVAVTVATSFSFAWTSGALVGLAILFVSSLGVGEISGHVILQHTNGGLAALTCRTAEIAELASSEPQDSWIGTCLKIPSLFDTHGWPP